MATVTPSDDPRGPSALQRATVALQGEPAPGWSDVADRVTRRVRALSRPGRPLTVRDDDAGVVRVDQRVLVDAVRRALARVRDCRPVGVAVGTGAAVTGAVAVAGAAGAGVATAGAAGAGVATSVRVEVWVRYGADVREVAAQARVAVTSATADVLGTALPVDVAVVDVEPAG